MEALTLGGRMRAARETKGLTQAKLAQLLDVPVVTLWRWEGDRMRPGIDALERVSTALEVSIDWLVRGDHLPSVPTVEGAGEVRS
jgi:transcriptional regulator with XRE-family HTH domain